MLFTDGAKETIDFFLDKGFTVMTFWMPLFGENVPTRKQVGGSHEKMPGLLGDSFIHVFVEPVFVGINYVKSKNLSQIPHYWRFQCHKRRFLRFWDDSNYSFRDITMTGVSGGGWTTYWCAALDPRIKLSFPTAGSLPLYLCDGTCPNGSLTDAEQGWPAIYGYDNHDGYDSITSWLDLHIMGGYGKNREQVQILNQYDDDCYAGINYRTYEPYVRDVSEQLGQGAYSA